jgi:hypothetical protein
MSRSDDEGGRVVPVYARSVGRDLPLETLVTTTERGLAGLSGLRFEQARIVSLCRRPTSVAEVAAELSVPVGVARVLVSDLNASGALAVHLPALNVAGRPNTDVLERLLKGLRTRA